MGNLIKSCNIGSSSGNRSIPSTNFHLSKDKQQPLIVGKGDETKKLINENGSAISPKQQATADDSQESSQSLLKDTVADDFKDEISSSTPTAIAAADSDLLSTITSSSCDVHVTYQSSVKQVYQRRKSTAALNGAIPPIDFPRIKLLPHEHTLFCERKVVIIVVVVTCSTSNICCCYLKY